MSESQIMDLMRAGWTLYERRDLVAYLIKPGEQRRPLPFMYAVQLRERGIVQGDGVGSRRVLAEAHR